MRALGLTAKAGAAPSLAGAKRRVRELQEAPHPAEVAGRAVPAG